MPTRLINDPVRQNYMFLAAVTVISVLILGASAAYVLFEYQGRPAPTALVLFLSLGLQQMANLLLGRGQRVIKEEARAVEERATSIDQKLDGGVNQLVTEMEATRTKLEEAMEQLRNDQENRKGGGQ